MRIEFSCALAAKNICDLIRFNRELTGEDLLTVSSEVTLIPFLKCKEKKMSPKLLEPICSYDFDDLRISPSVHSKDNNQH